MEKIRNGIFVRVFVSLSLITLASLATLCKILQYYEFNISEYDTGIYVNVVWNTLHGKFFYSDIHNANQLGEHFSPIVGFFVPLFIINPSPIWLIAAQGLAVGVTYVLIYFIALKILSDTDLQPAKFLALIFAVWAFFYRPLTSALLFEFHPSTLATPLLAAAVLALLYERDRLLWLFVGLLLLSKENAPLAILGLATYAWLVLSRPRLGLALITAAVVSATLIMNFVMPLFQSGPWRHYDRLGPLTEWREKAVYLYRLVAGLAFLPLASWRSLLCAVPLVAVNLSVAYHPQFSLNFHYDDFGSVFLLVAAIHGAAALLNLIGANLKGRHAISAYLVMAIIAVILAGAERTSVISFLRSPWPSEAEWQLYREIAPYRSLPIDVGIAANSTLAPYVAAQPRYVAKLDLTRLRPGDFVLVSPIKLGPCADTEKLMEQTTISFVRIHASSVLCVYEVTAVGPKRGDQ